ncbi:MAG: preprotein translocase subunit YajC [Chlorobi bacterium]|jgi:preprotein translocase subunit YajC|nr:preprotein translocase subunit YajC [Chlorobiota bacterium]
MNVSILAFQAGGGLLGMLIPFVLIFAIMYFLVIRPQQKRAKEQQALLASVKRGDEVTLSGGMYGKVTQVEEKTVLVEIARNTQVKFDKGAIQNIVARGEEA